MAKYQSERYEMMIGHIVRHPEEDRGPMEVLVIDEDKDPSGFYQIEVRCTVDICDWWDHWDERKEDWNGINQRAVQEGEGNAEHSPFPRGTG